MKIKTIALTSFIAILIQLFLIIAFPPSMEYELSIYSAYPIYFWFFTFIPIFLMFFSCFYYIQNEDQIDLKTIIYPSLAAILSVFIFLILPAIRNYYFFNPGDSFIHFGYVKSILESGFFKNDIYPITHILITNLSLITNLPPKIFFFFIAPVFTVFFIIVMFLVSGYFTLKPGEMLLTLSFCVIPIFAAESVYTVPSAEGFFLLPLILLILLNSRTKTANLIPYSILLVIMLITFPFFHLEASYFIFIIMTVLLIASNSLGKISSEYNLKLIKENFVILKFKNIITAILIITVTLIVWFYNSSRFGETLQSLHSSLFLNQGGSPASVVSGSSLSFNELIITILKIYGVDFFFILVSLITSIFFIFKMLRNKHSQSNYLIIYLLFYASLIFNMVFFFKGAIIGVRSLKYLMIFSVMISAITFYKIITHHYKFSSFKKISNVIIIIAMISVITLSLFNTYPSPTTLNSNYQMVQQEISGMDFIFQTGKYVPIITFTRAENYKDGIYGRFYPKNVLYLAPAENFGYKNSTHLGDFYPENRYLLFLHKAFNYQKRYTKEDFDKVENDNTIMKIYDNGEFRGFKIIGWKNRL